MTYLAPNGAKTLVSLSNGGVGVVVVRQTRKGLFRAGFEAEVINRSTGVLISSGYSYTPEGAITEALCNIPSHMYSTNHVSVKA